MTPSRDLAAALARGLHDGGVRQMFGVPGGGPNLDMVGAAAELGIAFVLAHDETAAAVMAGVHGRLTGTAGVALVTRGPGLTSALNGLAQATLDRAPLLLVSDTVPQAQAARVAHQRLDQVAAAAPLAKRSATLGTDDPEGTVAAALRLAVTPPAGGVHLMFDPTTPGDGPLGDGTVDGRDPDSGDDPSRLQRVRGLLAGARRPVLIVGLDAVPHAADVRAALEHFNVPILTTYQAKGVVPESWPTWAGLFTGSTLERPLLDAADVIVGLGLDPVEPLPGPWPYRAPVVLLHSHPVETRYFGEALLLVGDYDRDLATLVGACRSDWPAGTGRETRVRDLERLDPGVRPGDEHRELRPHDVVRVTRGVLGEAVLTVDAGAHMLVAMQLWATDEPDSVFISNGLSTMGYAVPAAIGAAFARPGRRVVAMTGDGGMGLVLAELETLARQNLDVTIVVFDDATLSLIELKQGAGQGGAAAVGHGPVDFAAVATAMGVPGDLVQYEGDLRAALEKATGPGCGPRLVDARIDPADYRHVIKVSRG